MVFISLASILVRLPYLNDIAYWWRSAQTLLTTYWMDKEGIQLLNYQTPLYGPPWQVPFEFPLYQAICAFLSKVWLHNIVLASHLISLLFFYLSAVLLFLLCNQYFKNTKISSLILVVYLWNPFDVRYSTEILIDYAALAFALGFLYFLKRWLDNRNNGLFAVLCLVSGSLCALVKVTTIPMIIPLALLLVSRNLASMFLQPGKKISLNSHLKTLRSNNAFLITLIGIAFIPLILLIVWTHYTDAIKNLNVFTQWLTSANLKDWTYGTLSQKTSLINWLYWFWFICFQVIPGIWVFFPIIALVERDLKTSLSRDLIISALSGIILGIFIFFNLYHHEYYYISITAWMAVLAGFGIYAFIKKFAYGNRIRMMIAAVVLLGLALSTIFKINENRSIVEREIVAFLNTQIPYADSIRNATPENQNVVSVQGDWYPMTLLFAERKGLVISYREVPKLSCEAVKGKDFTTVAGPQDDPNTDLVLGCFDHVDQVAPNIYRVR